MITRTTWMQSARVVSVSAAQFLMFSAFARMAAAVSRSGTHAPATVES